MFYGDIIEVNILASCFFSSSSSSSY